jgi:HPr kinase/phosphorylase
MPFQPSLTIDALLAQAATMPEFDLRLLAGAAGTGRLITIAPIQKTGLALAGFDSYLHPGRILVFGDSEVSFLNSLDADPRRDAVERALRRDIPCVLLTAGLTPPAELTRIADALGVPVLRTSLPTPVAISKLTALLEDRLAPRDMVHGVLLDVLGLGVLVVGESGIGKSECALDLVVRGHRLVADDAVEIRRRSESVLIGTCPALTRHHMEVRGIGLINVREMFGVASTRRSKRVEFVVQLDRWDPQRDYERLGLDETHYEILGLSIPMVRVPVAPGRNLAILVEVAARNQLLRARGQHAARALVERVDGRLRGESEAHGDPDDWLDLEDER